MAKIRVSPELIEQCMFDDEPVRIVGACMIDGLVVFDIEGSNVPQVEEVIAIVTRQQRSIRFEPL